MRAIIGMVKFGMRYLVVSTLMVLLAACSSFDKSETDVPNEPTPLLALTQQSLTFDKQWSTDVGVAKGRYAFLLSPVVDDEVVYAASEKGLVRALNSSDGKTLWEFNVKERITAGLGSDVYHLYVVTADARLVAIDKKEGKQVWSSALQGVAVAAPSSNNLVVVVNSIDGKISGFDPNSGRNYWIYQETVPEITARGNSRPQFLGAQWVVQGLDNGKVVALRSQEGGLAWERNINIANFKNGSQLTDVDFPILFTKKGMLIVTRNNSLLMLDSTTGGVAWQGDYDEPVKYISMAQGHVAIVSESDKVFVHEAETGDLIWVNDELRFRQLNQAALSATHVYVVDAQGVLHSIALAGGKIDGRMSTNLGTIANPVIVNTNQLLVTDNDGKMISIQSSATTASK